MNFAKEKTATVIALFLMFALAFSLVALPAANAHTPPFNIPNYVYMNAYPNPDGINQPISLFCWDSLLPFTASGDYGDRFTGLTITVTKPDGSSETLGPFQSDPVGTIFETYTPTTVGNYTFQFHMPAYTFTGTNAQNPVTPPNLVRGAQYINDTLAAADSAPVTVQVTEEQIPPQTSYPLPTDYWTQPVSQSGHTTTWLQITGDWLANGGVHSNQNDYNSPPTSAHIAWTKPLTFGGVAGLPSAIDTGGDNYYSYLSYERIYAPGIILNGRLYYNTAIPPEYGFQCVDLRTGEVIWYNNGTQDPLAVQQGPGGFAKQNFPQLSFGQALDYESPNQHGTQDYLWATYTAANRSSVWAMYDPFSGNWIMDIINVPPASVRFGASSLLSDSTGNYLIYSVDPNAKTLTVWNSTQCVQQSPASQSQANGYWMWRPQLGGIMDASLGTTIYNLTGVLPPGASSDSLMYMDQEDQLAIYGNITSILGSASFPTRDGYNMYAVSIDPANIGTVLWKQTNAWPEGNITFDLETDCIGGGVFSLFEKELTTWQTFSATTGQELWTSQPETVNHMYGVRAGIYNGVLYSSDASGTGGMVYAYGAQNGTLLWSYQAPPMGNNGYWAYTPTEIAAFSAGIIYWTGGEHSPGPALQPGEYIGALNATTGEQMWNITFWSGGAFNTADGYLTALNNYDNQIYSFGKGPTSTTLETPLGGVTEGQSFTIQGTVMDVSAGTQQSTIEPRFPNGVPAVSDASESAWMEYVYMQNPKPSDASGVPVSIDAIDPNGNSIHLGDTHSDSSGLYSFQVDPSMLDAGPGSYTVIATFQGSNSYWQSSAESAFTVNEAPQASPTPTPPPPSMASTYILGFGTAIIIIIIVGFAILILRKR